MSNSKQLIKFPRLKQAQTSVPAMYEHLGTKDVVFFISGTVGHSLPDAALNEYNIEDMVTLDVPVTSCADWKRCASGSAFSFTQD